MVKKTQNKNILLNLTLLSALLSFAFSQVVYSILGLVTETSFQLKAKSVDGLNIKLFLNNQVIQSLTSVSENGYYYEYTHSSLTPNTAYTLELEYAGTKLSSQKKTFRTPNYGNSNYTFAFMSSQKKPDDSIAYLRLNNRTADTLLFLGGISNDYYNEITETELQKMYQEALTNPGSTNLTLSKPFEYYLGDYCGKHTQEDSCSQAVKNTIAKVYKKSFPTSLAKNTEFNGFYSKSIRSGILFLHTDTQSFVNKETGTIFGIQQLTTIASELEKAATDASIKAIVITTNQPWVYDKKAYHRDVVKQKHYTLDDSFVNEKYILANATSKINFKNENATNYKPLMMIVGRGYLSFDQGNNNLFGEFPVATCGSINKKEGCKGGPYSHGYSNSKDDQYCLLKTYINPTTSRTCLQIQGWYAFKLNRNETNVFTWDTCEKDIYLGTLNSKCPIHFREKILHSFIILIIVGITLLLFYVLLYKIAEKTFDYKKIAQKEE